MNKAIILAGGSGSRLGGNLPKQFLKVAGKTILEHSIDAFHCNPRIDEITIVSRADFVDDVRDLVRRAGYTKVRHIVAGGKERYHSSLVALSLYDNDDDRLLFHDAVRPMVTQRMIDDCIDALDTYQAVEVAVPAVDTIVRVDKDDCISEMPPRAMLRNCQTPQGFHRRTIALAFEKALKDANFIPTDDCGVVHHYLPEVRIKIINGDPTNIKVTYPDDLALAERLLKK